MPVLPISNWHPCHSFTLCPQFERTQSLLITHSFDAPEPVPGCSAPMFTLREARKAELCCLLGLDCRGAPSRGWEGSKGGEDPEILSALPAQGPLLLGENTLCLKKEGANHTLRMTRGSWASQAP